MHHQLRAGAIPGAVIGVRIAEIESQIILRVRIHQAGRDAVEAFRRLAIAFLDFGTEIARPAADRIGLEQRIAAGAVLLPDFELGFFLEQANEDRRILRHVLLFHLRQQRWRDRSIGARVIGKRVFGLAAGERERTHKDRRRHQRANRIGAADQYVSPRKMSPGLHRAMVIPLIRPPQGADGAALTLLTMSRVNEP